VVACGIVSGRQAVICCKKIIRFLENAACWKEAGCVFFICVFGDLRIKIAEIMT
jgi:hypothetical protein